MHAPAGLAKNQPTTITPGVPVKLNVLEPPMHIAGGDALAVISGQQKCGA